MNPIPSLVLAFTWTAPADAEPGGEGTAIAARCGASFGRSVMTEQSACDGEAATANQLVGRAQQLHRVRVLPLRIAVGKELADVPGTGRAENSIGERVGHRVGIRMSGQPVRVRDGDAAQDERPARDEAVGVVADPHAGHAATGSSITL